MKLNRALLNGSIVLVITFGIFNILNYFYHFSMIRSLSLADYGLLATLFAIIYIVSIFAESIQTILAKYAASENDGGKLKNLFRRSIKKATSFAILLFIAYILGIVLLKYGSIFIVAKLIGLPHGTRILFEKLGNLPLGLVIFNGIIILGIFLSSVGRGIMQGKKMFGRLGVSMIIEGIIKLVLGVFFVYLGWRVYGALLGPIIGAFVAFIYTFIALAPIRKMQEKRISTPEIYKYSWPVFITTLTVLIFYNLDIIIANIVFDRDTVGLYAITSLIAKTIFFVTQPINRAMFPLAAEQKIKSAKKDNYNVLTWACISILLCVIIGLIALHLFPEFIILIATGKSLPSIESLLFYAAIGTSLLSFANTWILYQLSQGKVRHAALFPIFLVVEAVLLYTFSANLLEFVLAFMASSAIFLWGSIVLLKE